MVKALIFKKSIFIYFKNCIKFAWKGSISKANNLTFLGVAVLGITLDFLDIKMKFPDTWQWDMIASFIYLSLSWVIIFIFRVIFIAPYSIFKQACKKIHSLSKVDQRDLEHLLYGFFCEDTFIYTRGSVPCKKYDGKNEISTLKSVWTEIPIHAPKNSIASIKIELYNSQRKSKKSQFYFYFLDKEKKTKTITPSTYQKIPLDSKSCFSFKLVCDENYIIDEDASLWIEIESWQK